MRKKRGGYLIIALAVVCFFALSSIAWASVDKVICVPWQGDVNKQHTAIGGQAAQLKGVIKTIGTSAVYYKWVFGDGTPDSAVTSLSGTTKYNVATTHTYTAATGTPFTAKLQVSDTTPFALVKEDPYFLKIEDNTIDAKINIAIDKGLWWLYTQAYSNNPVYGSNYSNWVQTYDGSTAMAWVQTSYVGTIESPTASAVHAFGINNHKIKGNPDEDPYVEAVKFGMNYLVKGYRSSTSNPALRAVSIGVNHSDDPEAGQGSPNGYGIEVYGGNDHQPYQGGQIMDAIIASGVLPADETGRDFAPSTPKSHIWTYGELLQDMTDMHAWGQYDGGSCNGGICGSWWYNWNYVNGYTGQWGDNSASQWAAIGMFPAQEAPWNVIVPQWVKNYNINWLEHSKYNPNGNINHNAFGYNYSGQCAGDACLQTTTSGMVQMIFVNQTTADPKWPKAQKYIADNWKYFIIDNNSSWGGYKTYGWYSFAKAMRLSLPTPTTQIVKSSGATFDWYYGNPAMTTCTTEANCERGLAPRILETQSADGSWQSGNLTNPPLTTAWMIITLKPTLFASAPISCFSAAPNPSYANQPITFDPSCSGHSATGKGIANLTKFEWDWNNDGVYAAEDSTTSPTAVQQMFACSTLPCYYPVRLRVTDDSTPALTATAEVTISITEPPHPPVANAGGPYTTSLCANDTLKLDGSKSSDQDEGLWKAGCTDATCERDKITAWDWDLTPPLTGFNDKSGKVITLSAAEISSSFVSAGPHTIGLRVTDNTAKAYPGSNAPDPTINLTNAAFGTVDVKNDCICNLTARAKLNKIQLTWTNVSGAKYDIYRSTEGPNTGFTVIASDIVTTYSTYLDQGLTIGKKYYYRVVSKADTCAGGSNVASATTSTR